MNGEQLNDFSMLARIATPRNYSNSPIDHAKRTTVFKTLARKNFAHMVWVAERAAIGD